MEFHDVTFFLPRRKDKEKKLRVHIIEDPKSKYKYTIRINRKDESYQSPNITLFLEDDLDLISFKNSILSSFENLMRKRNEKK